MALPNFFPFNRMGEKLQPGAQIIAQVGDTWRCALVIRTYKRVDFQTHDVINTVLAHWWDEAAECWRKAALPSNAVQIYAWDKK